MPSMISLAFTTALAGVAAALPAAPATTTLGAPLARTTDFGIVLGAAAPYNGLVLRTQQSDTLGIKNIVFERPSAFTPEPAYLNGTADELDFAKGGYAYLNYHGTEVDGGDFGVRLPDVGDNAGYTAKVEVIFGAQNPAWAITGEESDVISGKLHAALNQFFACNVTFNGTNSPAETRLGLAFGNQKADGSNPDGCVPATLQKVDLSQFA